MEGGLKYPDSWLELFSRSHRSQRQGGQPSRCVFRKMQSNSLCARWPWEQAVRGAVLEQGVWEVTKHSFDLGVFWR